MSAKGFERCSLKDSGVFFSSPGVRVELPPWSLMNNCKNQVFPTRPVFLHASMAIFFGREWNEFILWCFQNSSASTMKQKKLAAISSALTSFLLGNRLCFRFKWIGYPQLCHLIGADAAGATQAKGMPFGARFFFWVRQTSHGKWI